MTSHREFSLIVTSYTEVNLMCCSQKFGHSRNKPNFSLSGKIHSSAPARLSNAKVISQSGVNKQKNQLTSDLMGPKSGPVFMLKVVYSLAFDNMLFNKSSIIFPMN